MYRQNFNNDTIFNSESLGNDDEYNSPTSKKKKNSGYLTKIWLRLPRK